MAREKVTFKVNLRQNQNSYSNAYGHYYAEPDVNEPLNLKGFARHLSEHGKLAGYDMLVLVLNNIVDCMGELLSQGQPVKLDGLGTFRPTITNSKPAASGVKARNTVEDSLAVGLDEIIEGVNITFIPENTKGEKLTSKAFKEQCVFEAAYVISSKKKTVDGKEVTYQEKIPISSYAVATAQPDAQGGGGEGGNG